MLIKILAVIFRYGICYHFKTFGLNLFQGFIAQNFQRSLIYADNLVAVQAMTYYAAVHGGKQVFQLLGFLQQRLFIGLLLCDVNSHANSAHNTAVNIIKR